MTCHFIDGMEGQGELTIWPRLTIYQTLALPNQLEHQIWLVIYNKWFATFSVDHLFYI